MTNWFFSIFRNIHRQYGCGHEVSLTKSIRCILPLKLPGSFLQQWEVSSITHSLLILIKIWSTWTVFFIWDWSMIHVCYQQQELCCTKPNACEQMMDESDVEELRFIRLFIWFVKLFQFFSLVIDPFRPSPFFLLKMYTFKRLTNK